MNLQTKISLRPIANSLIDYTSDLFLIGSCFVENIGEKLDYYKFQNLQNPFGVIFNTLAIERLITSSLEERVYNESDVFFNNERWHSFHAHSRISAKTKEEAIETLNSVASLTKKKITDSSHIIITLGTAWVYRHIQTDLVVANCHKVANNEFEKRILSIEEIVRSLSSMVSSIRKVNPDSEIILTISPVRHLKDGIVENSQSKAQLLSALHKFISQTNSSKLSYFPSYEIMMDELRDYRFYAEDMIHPNPVAIKYIWQKFKDLWIAPSALKTLMEIESIQKGLAHRPFNEESDASKMQKQELVDRIKAITYEFPYMEF